MAEKKLDDYTYQELLDECTGIAIIELGQGKPFKDIIANVAYRINYWTWILAEKKNKKLKNENSVR